MIKKHGTKEAVRQAMADRQKLSRENYTGKGGFAYLKEHDPDKLKEITTQGGKRRWK